MTCDNYFCLSNRHGMCLSVVKDPNCSGREIVNQQPITEKQKALIEDMQEFSDYPLPKFTGKAKSEASDYIDKYGKLAHEDVNSPFFGY